MGHVIPRAGSPGLSMPARGSRREARPIRIPKTVLLDMDDTIFDHSLTCRDALARLRQENSYLRTRSLAATWADYLRLLDEVQPDVLAGRLTADHARSERFRRLASSCGRSISGAEAEVLSRSYRHHYQQLRRAVPGARSLLEALADRTTLGIVTNNQVAEQEEKLSFLGFAPLVDFMVVSEAVGAAKPDPRIFRVALERAGALPEETVMVGDSWWSDVVGARGVGIRPVWFNRFGKPRPEGPTNVAELRSWQPVRKVERMLAGTPDAPANPLR